MNGRDVIKRLQQEGWTYVRTKGSHHILRKGGQTVTVPVHGAADIPIGTLKSIARVTGIKLP